MSATSAVNLLIYVVIIIIIIALVIFVLTRLLFLAPVGLEQAGYNTVANAIQILRT